MPHTGQNLLLGAFAGLVAALSIAIARDASDTRVRSAESLSAALDRPVLGTLPTARGTDDPVSDAAVLDAVRRLRDRVFSVSEAPRLVVACGALPESGVTTLLRALAQTSSGSRGVLVVDANLRRPTLGDRVGVATTPGLAEVLSGAAQIDDVIRSSGTYDVIPAGEVPDDPGGLLVSGRISEVLTNLRSRYDVLLVDAPPLAPVADAAILGRLADGIVLVARAGVTTVPALRSATETVAQFGAHLTGSVLTFSDVPTSRYGSTSTAGTESPAGSRVNDRTGRTTPASERSSALEPVPITSAPESNGSAR